MKQNVPCLIPFIVIFTDNALFIGLNDRQFIITHINLTYLHSFKVALLLFLVLDEN